MMGSNRRKRGSVAISIGLVLLAASIGLTVYNVFTSRKASATAETVLTQLVPQIESQHSSVAANEPDLVVPTEEVEIPDYVLVPQMEMPSVEACGFECIGVLEIPTLEVTLPIIGQWSYEDLKNAPCRYSGSAYTDDFVIAGHNYAGHFGSLSELSLDDEIIFTDIDGNVFRYLVAEFETLQPTDIEYMTSGDYDLTMFTCTVSGQSRFTVRAERTDG